MTTKRLMLAVGLAVAALVGCSSRVGSPPGPTPAVAGDYGLTLFVRNETDRAVVVFVDGSEALRVEAGQRIKDRFVIVPAAPPNTVEVRTAAGHVFGSFQSDERGEFGVPGLVKNTRCGDIWVWLNHGISAEIAPQPPERQEDCG